MKRNAIKTKLRTGPKNKGIATAKRLEKTQKALEFVEKWSQMSPQAQLDSLDERLGKGMGAQRQRARIQEQVQEIKNA